MFLNSSGIISFFLNWLESKKFTVNFFLTSRISARYIPNYFVLLGTYFLYPFASLLVKVKQNLQANPETSKQQGHWNGRKWLKERVNCCLLIHDATWEGNGNAEVYCVSRWTFAASNWRKILVIESSVIISPGGYLEALLSPGLLLEVTCLILNHFWRKGLIKFRKRKLNLFRIF